jgi:hypothetical protein
MLDFHFARSMRKPVERAYAGGYVRLTLLSFAATVGATRLFLAVTGYPQLGSRTLHIGHMLWGGLFLFVSALIMLIFVNRWAYALGALLSGIGVGLFIDEVGKFITRTNDYFYPPAAPIIYAFFLLVLLIYLELRRPPACDARTELYRTFDDLQEVLDRDLDAQERAALQEHLNEAVRLADHPDLKRLAEELLHFVNSDTVVLAPHELGWQERGLDWLRLQAQRHLTRRRLKAVLVGGLGALGIIAVVTLSEWFLAIPSPARMAYRLADLLLAGRLGGPGSLTWLVGHIALKGASGLLLLIGAVLLVIRRDRQGLAFSYIGLLLSLTIVDLMEFYFSQFSAMAPAAVQFGLLLVLLYYRRRYVPQVLR